MSYRDRVKITHKKTHCIELYMGGTTRVYFQIGKVERGGDMRTHCRCRNCGSRQTTAKHPDEYRTPPRCRGCGQRWHRPRTAGKYVTCARVPVFRVDRWANARSWRKHTCRCDGYPWPHREGSRWCRENPCYGYTLGESYPFWRDMI